MRLACRLSARLTRAYPVLLLFVLSTAAAPTVVQDKTGRVTGHVRDPKGASLANVQILVEGTALTAVTDSAGSYLLAAVPEGTVQLRAVFIGYVSSRAIIKVRAGRTTTHDFTLQPANAQLEEITVKSADVAAADNQTPTNQATPRTEAAQKRYSASGAVQAFPSEPWRWQREPGNTEAYNRIEDNRFLAALANPLSTFSIDVDALFAVADEIPE